MEEKQAEVAKESKEDLKVISGEKSEEPRCIEGSASVGRQEEIENGKIIKRKPQTQQE